MLIQRVCELSCLRVYTRVCPFGRLLDEYEENRWPLHCRRRSHQNANSVVLSGTDDYYLGVNAITDRLRPEYWWSDPTVAWDGPGVVILAALLAAVFVGAAAALVLAPCLTPSESHYRHAVTRTAAWILGGASTGLLLLLFRWQVTPFFGRRLWLFLWMAVALTLSATALTRALRDRFRRGVIMR